MKTLINHLFLTGMILLLAFHVSGQQESRGGLFTGAKINRNSFPRLNAHFRKFELLRLNARPLRSYLLKNGSIKRVSLRLSQKTAFELELEPAEIVSDHYLLRVQTAEGVKIVTGHPDYLYKGRIAGKSKSIVRLAVRDGFISGNIVDDGKSYFIDPLRKFSSGAGPDDLVLYTAADIIDTGFACGSVGAANRNELSSSAAALSRPGNLLDGACKRAKFNITADYSIYQKFNYSIADEETALLSNLNIAEGAFASLNLGPDNSTDTGTDMLHFEAEQMFLSTCDACDLMGKSGYLALMMPAFKQWMLKYTDTSCFTINQFWTTRDIYITTNLRAIGEADGGLSPRSQAQFLKYYTDNSASLKVLVAHETGHNFGCEHDDQLNPAITQFIMCSHADASADNFADRFSRLSDFGGIPYSSQLVIRNSVIKMAGCFADCQAASCPPVQGLHLEPQTGGDVQLRWSDTGLFKLTTVAELSSGDADPIIEYVNSNQGSIKGLESCTTYRTGIQRVCQTDTSGAATIVFSPSSIMVSLDTVNIRDSLYDLQMNIDCTNCSAAGFTATIDHVPHATEGSGNTLKMDNLFADGAKHRIDIIHDSLNNACSAPQYFTAPDYRSGSTKLFAINFDSCSLPTGWTDSLIRKMLPSYTDHPWKVAFSNVYSSYVASGNFDSTCMLIFDSYYNFKGASALLSPSYDLSDYRHVSLGFDYNFFAEFGGIDSTVKAFFKIEAFTGSQWVQIFKVSDTKDYWYHRLNIAKNIWDSIPGHVHINLDDYINKDFKLRFIADDGSVYRNTSFLACYLMMALDNIRLDGYPLANSSNDQTYTVFPNPSGSEIYIRFLNNPFPGPLQYRILDLLGQEVSSNALTDSRIDIRSLKAGIYILQLYSEGKQVGRSFKVVKM